MESAKKTKDRRPRRSKADIEEAIQKAAVSQIRKKGFSLALVTDIVRRARIEPIVFYNRFKNLAEFYDDFVKSYDYWLPETFRGIIDEIGTEEGYTNMIEKYFNALLNNDMMVELIRWEIADGNPTTERTSRLRELHALEIMASHHERYAHPDIDMKVLTTLLISGLYYLVLHRNRSSMVGIDINKAEGRHRVINTIRELAAILFRDHVNENLLSDDDMEKVDRYRRNFEKSFRERLESDFRCHLEEVIEAKREADHNRIAANLRAQGISDEIIARCLANNVERED